MTMSKMDIEMRECHHGLACVIVTQTKPNHKKFGKSVYMCGSTDRCTFKEEINIPLQTCDSHKSLVKVRRFQEEQEKTIILYHCAAATSNEWCGSWEVVSEEVEDKENFPPNEEAIEKEVWQSNETFGSGKGHVCESFEAKDTIAVKNRDTTEDSVDESGEDSSLIQDNKTYERDEESVGELSVSEEDVNNSNSQNITDDDTSSEEPDHDVIESNHGNTVECYDGSGTSVSEEDRTEINQNDSSEKSEGSDTGVVVEEISYVKNSDMEEANNVSVMTCGDDTGSENGLVRETNDEGEGGCDEMQPLNEGCGHGTDQQNQLKIWETPPNNRLDEDGSNYKEGSPSVCEPVPLKYRETPHVDISSESDSDNSVVCGSSDDEEEREGCGDPATSGAKPTTNSAHRGHAATLNGHSQGSDLLVSPTHALIHTDHREEKEPTVVDEDETEESVEKRVEFKVGTQFRKLVKQLVDHQLLIEKYGPNLPDGGARLREQERLIKQRMFKLRGYVPGKEEMLEFLNKPVQEGEGGEEERVPVKQRFHSTALHGYAKELTYGAIQNLHSSLASCPTEDSLADNPEELTVTLMDHQRRALAWLRWREEQIPRGGILADDMGLGKTLSMISLVLTQRDKAPPPQSGGPSGLIWSKATLVVVPLTLLNMWESEIRTKLDPHTLSVLIYHGPKRTKYPQDLTYYDVVITTYNIVGTEAAPLVEQEKKKKVRRTAASDTLFQVHWDRVVLDEGHNIRNPKTATSIGCCALKSDHRWVMTGTPIQNKLEDFYSLIKFLRVSPFDDLRVWKDTIANRSSLGMQRLKAMVSSLVLRRTKEEMMEIKAISLPQKSLKIHEIELDDMEKKIYDVLFCEGRGFFQRYLIEQGEVIQEDHTHSRELLDKLPPNVALAVKRIISSVIKEDSMIERSAKGRTVLVLLLRLRQACSHLNLLCSALEPDPMAGELELALAMEAVSLSNHEGEFKPISDVPEEFNKRRPSAKVREIIKGIEEVFSSPEENGKPNKCIIVSQWTSMFNVLEYHLNRQDISYTRIDGKVPAHERQNYVMLFNSPRANPRVMLLSLQAGGVGLTLTGANHVFIIDLHWNPQLEQQASDRCHRVGQTRDVVVHRLVVKDTVEIGIQAIQQKKLQLAHDVLSGADKKKRRANFGLTLADLKQLFDIS